MKCPNAHPSKDFQESACNVLEQALAGTADDLNPLRGGVTSDVAIVGGGFVGLWTALMIKRLTPPWTSASSRRIYAAAEPPDVAGAW